MITVASLRDISRCGVLLFGCQTRKVCCSSRERVIRFSFIDIKTSGVILPFMGNIPQLPEPSSCLLWDFVGLEWSEVLMVIDSFWLVFFSFFCFFFFVVSLIWLGS